MSDADMCLEYENEQGNHRVRREYYNHDAFIQEVDIHERYNYVENRWQRAYRFTNDYDLASDGETLAGDGSNWRGTGRNWREYFQERHTEKLVLRFPNEEIY